MGVRSDGKGLIPQGEWSVSYSFTNTPPMRTPITEGDLIDDRHKPNNRKPNTTEAIAQLGLQSEGISD
jgi:hypothetical protein